jgi:iron complex transport system ATP-binding protein
VLVRHDINQASRYSQHLIAMRDGQILAQGTPAEVITEKVVASTFGISS